MCHDVINVIIIVMERYHILSSLFGLLEDKTRHEVAFLLTHGSLVAFFVHSYYFYTNIRYRFIRKDLVT